MHGASCPVGMEMPLAALVLVTNWSHLILMLLNYVVVITGCM